MSGKKKRNPFENEEDDLGFRDPQHHKEGDTATEEEVDDVENTKAGDDEEEDDGEDHFDDEERGWHTFDLDNPDENL